MFTIICDLKTYLEVLLKDINKIQVFEIFMKSISDGPSLFRKSFSVPMDFLSWNKDLKEGSKHHFGRNSSFEAEKT